MILGTEQRALGTLERLGRLTRLASFLQTLVAECVTTEGEEAGLVLAGRGVRAVARGTAQHTGQGGCEGIE